MYKRQFEAALPQPRPTLLSIRGLAKLHTTAKRFDDAFKALDTALTKERSATEYWLGIADLYRDTGLATQTKMDKIKSGIITSLDRATALSPESPLTLHRLADYFIIWG